jgi:hypothetical protein
MTAFRALSPPSFPALLALFAASLACAQSPPPDAPAPSPPDPPAVAGGAAPAGGPVAQLAWLAGCWKGNVNQREFREQWLPMQGGKLIGAGQQVMGGAMQDYEFLRIEAKAEGVYFTQFSGDLKAVTFRLADIATDRDDTVFTFANAVPGFPQRLVYRRGKEGWLYETIEGTLNGAEKKVVYPLRRVDCETGELIAG